MARIRGPSATLLAGEYGGLGPQSIVYDQLRTVKTVINVKKGFIRILTRINVMFAMLLTRYRPNLSSAASALKLDRIIE